MSLQTLLNQSIDVYRLEATTGSKKQNSKVATIKIMIQPMSASSANIAGIAFTRAFQGFVLPGSNVLIGDTLHASDGAKYDVQGARNYAMGSQPFIELALQRNTQQGEI